MKEIECCLLQLELDDNHDLIKLLSATRKMHFDCSCTSKKLLNESVTLLESKAASDSKAMAKLPKLEVPKFTAEILKWRSFWDMFEISVHDQESTSNPEKLLYLRQAMSGSPAAQVIEGLCHTGDQYEEEVTCLQNCYDQPRAVHEAYVKVIVEYRKLKEGSSKELRKLHDVMLQNIRALSTLGHNIDSKFMTSLIQLKLDANTTFAWREASKDALKEVPDYKDLLKFVDQRLSTIS